MTLAISTVSLSPAFASLSATRTFCIEFDGLPILEVPAGKMRRNFQRPRKSVMKEKAALWRGWLDSGHVKNQNDIARKAGVSKSYVNRVINELGEE